ncbi:MAG TPA: nucleotidyl transferase AbiEii/AbiGii toxin family protein [Solirubrobacteraceae bacterium]
MSDRRYDTTPKNRRALEQRLRNVIADTELQQRARRQLGYVALAATLMRHARDEHDEPVFLIKGGVAVELLLGLRARATKDLDASARLTDEDIGPRLRAALAHGWEGFTFRLTGLEQVRDTAALRGDVKVSYQGDPWSTVQFEASPAEGTAGRQMQWTGNTFVDPEHLGLPSPGELPLVTIAYLIAQKLHACTDHTDDERSNDRYRDLIDLMLVDRLVRDEDRAGVREVCVEIFRLRAKHAWPPRITVLSDWPEGHRTLAEQLGFVPADVHQAATDVQEIIARIDTARPTD